MVMLIVDCSQGSPEWRDARIGIPTASGFINLITPVAQKPTVGDRPRKYRMKKLAEWLTGEPQDDPQPTLDMERGTSVEQEARDWYAFQVEPEEVFEVGFIYKDASMRVGCSPDLMLASGEGAEIKCPRAPKHLEVMLSGEVPAEHYAQVQGAIWIAEAEAWDYVSYHPRLDPVRIRVPRDDGYIDLLSTEVQAFNVRMLHERARLVKLGHEPAEIHPPVPIHWAEFLAARKAA